MLKAIPVQLVLKVTPVLLVLKVIPVLLVQMVRMLKPTLKTTATVLTL